MTTRADNKKIVSWAFYDWANSAFATTVMAGFFPLFFKQYLSADSAVTESSFRLGLANSIASVLVLVLAPVMGAIADRAGAKKRFLALFAVLGIVMTAALSLVARGEWQLGVLLYVLGSIGFAGGNVFYDSLILAVTDERRIDAVSALGFALGYLGGGILFAVNVFMVLNPETFGLADAMAAARASFVSVAVWWAVFSIPVFLFVEEPRNGEQVPLFAAVGAGLRQLRATFDKVRKLRVVFLFLVSYWFYIDALDTIVRMAIDYGLSLGFKSSDLITALLITQFVGFPAAIVFGRIGERTGPKPAILVGLGIYIAVTVWAFYMDAYWEFYGLAVAIGLVQGGVQSLSRSLYARLIPADKAGEFFGFYNMMGKFAAVMGPALMGWIAVMTGNPRYSVFAILGLFLIGATALCFVNVDEGRRMAKELENG